MNMTKPEFAGEADFQVELPASLRRVRAILSGGGGGGGGDQNVTTTQQPPAFQLPNLELLQERARQFVQQPPPQFFPQSTVADFQPGQIAGQNQILQFAGQQLPGLANQAIASNQFALGPALDPASNPFLQATAQNAAFPIIRAFEQITQPAINSQAISQGQFGSTRHGIAEGLAGQGAIDAVARNTLDLFNQNYQNAAENAIRAQALAPQILGLGTLPGQLTSAVGDVRQAQDQAFLQDAINRFNFNQQAPVAQLSQFQNLIGGQFGGQSSSQGTVDGSGNPLAGAIGGALSGFAAAPALTAAFPALAGIPGIGPILGGVGALFGLLG